jgi:hypothetical protein
MFIGLRNLIFYDRKSFEEGFQIKLVYFAILVDVDLVDEFLQLVIVLILQGRDFSSQNLRKLVVFNRQIHFTLVKLHFIAQKVEKELLNVKLVLVFDKLDLFSQVLQTQLF